ncbi:SGNH/GDSL hydrolase family protein [Roseofilum casamattae]|uniref:SGNH/GDSL hydrolase family protein n=1 Tax=Roseofilum casamattae BLCC-M143 TaxID=3022442 RepID=A0ABT7BYR5_9CYAN|nr:SGNH/GDSL hydrolase family protein [Roseofilum casamattae]MDJ1184338.1 SGNH/GDSL hydrolase family protein [Roseofilum casamattae BLCC-M143]
MPTSSMKQNRIKTWVGNLGLATASILFAVLIAEIGLRIANIPPQAKPQPQASSSPEPEPQPEETPAVTPPSPAPPPPEPSNILPSQQNAPPKPPPGTPPANFFQTDEDLGWTHQPGVSGWWIAEGEAFIEISSTGLRDREHSLAKPDNTFRIAILGDSFSEGLQVPLEQTYWSLMEQSLATCPQLQNQTVEVINFGVTNYGTGQQLLRLRRDVWNYDPDLVLLAVFTGNDIADNYKPLDPRNRPYFVYDREGNLQPDMSFRTPDKSLPPYNLSKVDFLPGWLVKSSRILQLLRKVEKDVKNRELEKLRQYTYNSLYREPEDENWENAWQITEDLMALMHEEVRAKGAEFMLVTLSNEVQVNPDPAFRDGFVASNGIADLFYPDRRIKALGDRRGFTVVNLVGPLQAYAQENQVCLHGFANAVECGGHWNDIGHAIAAQVLTPQVCQYVSSINNEQ